MCTSVPRVLWLTLCLLACLLVSARIYRQATAQQPRSVPATSDKTGTPVRDLSGLTVMGLNSQTPANLATTLLGTGVTISNVQFTGSNLAAGTFTGGDGIIGFGNGVILTSGSVQNVVGPNVSDDVTRDNGLPGDSTLNTLIPGFSTLDATVLEFDFVPTTNTITFQYVFASDEYNEFANLEYNDVFGFFLNGQNVAKLPGTNIAVSINNVNGGNPLGTNPHLPQFYLNNDLSDGGGNINTGMDGLTQVLSIQAQVNQGQVNHIKLAIADVGDRRYDSAVFIKAASFTTTFTPQLTALEVTQGIQDLNNSAPLIQDKRTFVRAHVKSPQGDLTQVSAKLIGTRIEANNVRIPLGELLPSNIGQTIKVLQNPERIKLNDSFYFELPGLPQDWRRGTIELEFQGMSHNFSCREPDNDTDPSNNNDCKVRVGFVQMPRMEVNIVSIVWRRLLGFPTYRPSDEDVQNVVNQLESTFPIPGLTVSRSEYTLPFDGRPYGNLDEVLDNEGIAAILSQLRLMRLLDGCYGNSCKRYYLGILANPPFFGTAGATPYRSLDDPSSDVTTAYADNKFSAAHEFGHATGRKHTLVPRGKGNPANPDPNYQPSSGLISEDDSDNGFFGFNIFSFASGGIYRPITADLMSYEMPIWISPYTYRGIKDHLAARYAASSLGHQNIAAGQPLALVIVTGSILPAQGTGQLGSIYIVNSPILPLAPVPGPYAVRFENAQGQILATYNFEPDKVSEGSISPFTLALPLSANTSRIVLLGNGQTLASRNVSANSPTVTVTYPNGGESLTGATATFIWSASDPDNNPLSYVVQYSKDAGTTWQTLISDLTATSYEVNLQVLAGTNQGLVRVLASDGYFTAQDQSNATFSVAKHAPQPVIQAPENNHLYVGDQTIILEGGAYDNEDGRLGDGALSWSSNLNGPLGNGHSLAVNAATLTEGTHIVTLTAQDSDGQTGSTTINMQVSRTRPILPARLSLAPAGLSFLANLNGGQTPAQVLAIRNDGDGIINWSAGANQSWIKLSFASGITPANLPVAADPTGLAVGQYTGLITVVSPGALDSPQTIEVVLNVIAADVSVNQVASPNPAVAGSPLTYTITVTNSGPNTAASVTVTDNLPSAVTFVSCNATGGGVCGGSGNNRTVTFSSLISGASATITLVTQVNCSVTNGATISNTATVSSTTSDPNLANNSASAMATASNPIAIAPTSQSFPATGGTGSVGVTTPSGCSWTAVSNATWLIITSNAGGTGNGSVSYSVSSNAGPSPRTGTLTITGRTFTVIQAAPGLLLDEIFASGIPATWTVIDGGSGGGAAATWTTANSGNRTIGAPLAAPFAIVDSDFAGNGATQDEQLITPTLNATGCTQVILDFSNQFQWFSGGLNEIADVDVSTNGGAAWTNVLRMQGGDDGYPTPNTKSINISSAIAANPANVKVRFHYYNGSFEWWWAIDNVKVRCQVCAPGAITVNPANPTLPPGTAGQPYSQTFTATGGVAPYSFTVSAGTLPPGLNLSTGGILSGAPTGFGTFGFTVKATDANGCMGTRAYSLVINPPCGAIIVNPATVPNGFVGTAYNQTFTASGGTAPYSFSVSAGGLPNGLSLSSAGVLSGIPSATGTFNFTIKAADNNGCMGTRPYTVIISGTGLVYYPLPAPVRLLDTRPGFQGCNTPGAPLIGNTDTLHIARGACTGVPSAALAIVGNATVVNAFPSLSSGGFVTLYPSNAQRPNSSNLNFTADHIVPNAFTVGLGGDGGFKIYTSASTHFIVDITGYFAPPGTGGLFYHPLPAPVRLLDTRPGFQGCNTPGAPLVGNTDTLHIARGACTGVPSAALAIVGNATVVNASPTISAGGHVTLYPSNASRPNASNLNFVANQIVPNAFTVGLGGDGGFKIYTFAGTHFIVDITGYYSAEAVDTNGAGLLYSPLAAPVRLLDTRPGFQGCNTLGAPLPGDTDTLQIARGACTGVPNSALAIVGNATIVNASPTISAGGHVTLYPSNAPRPNASNLNFVANQIVPNAFTVGLGGDGGFKIYTAASTHFIVDLTGFFAP